VLSITHPETPQMITQPRVVSVYNDENHELVQPFDEVITMAICNPKLQST